MIAHARDVSAPIDRSWRRRHLKVHRPSLPIARPAAPDELREHLAELYPVLWRSLTAVGRTRLVADYSAAKRLGELAAAETLLDWLMTLHFMTEPGYLEHAGRAVSEGDRVDDLDEFLSR